MTTVTERLRVATEKLAELEALPIHATWLANRFSTDPTYVMPEGLAAYGRELKEAERLRQQLEAEACRAPGGGSSATASREELRKALLRDFPHIRRKDDKGPKVTSSEVLKKILAEKGAAGLYEGMGGRALQCFVEDFVFFWCVHRRSPTARQIAPPFPGRDLKKK